MFQVRSTEALVRFSNQLEERARLWGFEANWAQKDFDRRSDHSAIWGIQGYEMESAPSTHRVGVLLDLNEATEEDPIEIAPALSFKNFPAPEAIGSVYSFGSEQFRFSNIGARQMHLTTRSVDELIEQNYKFSKEKKRVFVGYQEDWFHYHSKMGELQSSTSLMTMLNYKQRKPYLVREDLQNLNMRDTFTPANSEYIVVTRELGLAPFQMKYQQYKDSLLAAMRIARSGGGISVDDVRSIEEPEPGSLPCLQRLSGAPKKQLKNFFAEAEAKGLKVAELTRFSRFQKIPSEVLETLILRAYEFAFHPTDPIDIFVMEVDPVTRRLFSKYGLVDLAQFPTEEHESAEYLMMVDTRTASFRKVLENLRAETATFTASLEVPKPVSAQQVVRRSYEEAFAEDPLEKFNLTKETRLREGLRTFRSMKSASRSRLKDERVTTRAQVLKTVNQVMALDLKGSGPSILKRLSNAGREELRNKVAIFSGDFESVVSGLNQFASTEGEIVFVGAENRVYSEALKAISRDRKIRVVDDMSDLSQIQAGSIDALVISEVFAKSSRWGEHLKAANRVLKRNRVLLTLDPIPSRGWSSSMPKSRRALRDSLIQFGESALKNGALMTETELKLSLLIGLEFFHKTERSGLRRRQIPDYAENHGFEDHFNYGFQLSWLMGGELNWMHKE